MIYQEGEGTPPGVVFASTQQPYIGPEGILCTIVTMLQLSSTRRHHSKETSVQEQHAATAFITVQFLKSVRIFSSLSRAEIEQIKPNFFPRKYRRRETIFFER
jgi:hypothetical protein